MRVWARHCRGIDASAAHTARGRRGRQGRPALALPPLRHMAQPPAPRPPTPAAHPRGPPPRSAARPAQNSKFEVQPPTACTLLCMPVQNKQKSTHCPSTHTACTLLRMPARRCMMRLSQATCAAAAGAAGSSSAAAAPAMSASSSAPPATSASSASGAKSGSAAASRSASPAMSASGSKSGSAPASSSARASSKSLLPLWSSRSSTRSVPGESLPSGFLDRGVSLMTSSCGRPHARGLHLRPHAG